MKIRNLEDRVLGAVLLSINVASGLSAEKYLQSHEQDYLRNYLQRFRRITSADPPEDLDYELGCLREECLNVLDIKRFHYLPAIDLRNDDEKSMDPLISLGRITTFGYGFFSGMLSCMSCSEGRSDAIVPATFTVLLASAYFIIRGIKISKLIDAVDSTRKSIQTYSGVFDRTILTRREEIVRELSQT